MEEGGFTIVTAEENTNHGTKVRGSDGVNTFQGVTQEEALEYFNQKQQQKKNRTHEVAEEDYGLQYTTNKKKKEALLNDFYKF